MTQYPLLFTFLDKVEGKEFLAEVAVHGRLLAEEADGAWWMYGINPGALAATGKTCAEAYTEFRASLMKVLFDIAADEPDFYDFRARAKGFFEEDDKESVAEWESARERVRRGEITLEGLKREPAPLPPRIDIKEKVTFNPQGNVIDPQVAVAA
jgi:hypothetical protein